MTKRRSVERPMGVPPPSVPITKGVKVVKGAKTPPPSTPSDGKSSWFPCLIWMVAAPLGLFALGFSLLATGGAR